MLRNISIAKRAAISFGCLTGILFLVGAFCIWEVGALNRETRHLNDHWLGGVLSLQKFNSYVSIMRLESIRLRSGLDESHKDARFLLIKEMRDHLTQELASYTAREMTSEESELAKELDSQLGDYSRDLDIMLSAMAPNSSISNDTLQQVDHKIAQDGTVLEEKMLSLISYDKQAASEASDASQRLYEHIVAVIAGTIALSLVVSLILAWAFSKSIVGPIKSAVEVARSIAEGRLDKVIESEGGGRGSRIAWVNGGHALQVKRDHQ